MKTRYPLTKMRRQESNLLQVSSCIAPAAHNISKS